MKITYTIVKKRGNWRPVLTYTCEKEDWEVELRVRSDDTDISVICAPSWESYVVGPYDADSQAEVSKRAEHLHFPTAADKSYTRSITLPWRAGAHPDYPEVRHALEALMTLWETRVQQALTSSVIDSSGEIEHSPEHKRIVAPYVAQRRMLGG